MSLQVRRRQLNAQAIEAVASVLTECVDADERTIRKIARRVMRSLRDANPEFCPACYYKRKRATGDPLRTDGVLADIEAIVGHHQRDGDGGDLDIRRNHVQQVLDALLKAGKKGLTDAELQKKTRIFLDSAKGCRANLMAGGWVVASGRKRLSPRGRPMTVWILSDPAKEALQDRNLSSMVRA